MYYCTDILFSVSQLHCESRATVQQSNCSRAAAGTEPKIILQSFKLWENESQNKTKSFWQEKSRVHYTASAAFLHVYI